MAAMSFSEASWRLISAGLLLSRKRGLEAAFFERYGTSEHKFNVALYRAHSCCSDPEAWCRHVSHYLSQFGFAPITIEPGSGSFFARFRAKPAAARHDGPKVSVLIAAYNAEDTVEWAVQSILDQTWRNLEVLIVDDASPDGTWEKLCQIAQRDNRVRIFRNSENAGPFVSRNRVLDKVTGTYLTGHDADDWAHPERIARQFERLQSEPRSVAVANYMLRIDRDLKFRHIDVTRRRLADSPARLHPVSSLFQTDAFRQRLGHWDSVRFSGDGELLKRAQAVFGAQVQMTTLVSNLSLDTPTSIMNHGVHGRTSGKRSLSPTRVAYRSNYASWHEGLTTDSARLEFPLAKRPFEAPSAMVVDPDVVQRLLASDSRLQG